MTTRDDGRVGAHHMLRRESLTNWQHFARSHKVTLTALLDTLGYGVGPLINTPDDKLPPVLGEALVAARELDLERTLRPGPRRAV